MKKIGLVALFALLLAACDDGGEKKAQLHLQKAETALKQENFNEAKLQIDSIRILYPKAFEARKQGIRLMQQVDLKEQQKSLVYLDSMMQVKQAQLDSIKGNFVLEKDTAYQEVGNYFYPTQTVEKNIGRSFLRGQVNEQGEMSITSIYCAGGKPVWAILLPKLPRPKTVMRRRIWGVPLRKLIIKWAMTVALSGSLLLIKIRISNFNL